MDSNNSEYETKMANDVQLDSFVKKFKQLIYFGHTAHLVADTHAGQASVSLRVMLGTASRPKQQRRSPSYIRRQEKRKAARQQVEVQTTPRSQECFQTTAAAASRTATAAATTTTASQTITGLNLLFEK